MRDLEALPLERRRAALRTAAAKAAADFARFPRWGDMHRLKIAHFLAQVPVINEAFTPTEEAIAGARRIVAAFAAAPGAGALQLDGRMVDAPHLAQAKRLLALAGESV